MEARLEIFTLGGVQVLRTGEPVTGLSTRKAEALLIYLATTRRPQPREVLADLLWDERTQSQAMGNLRGVLTNLRQVLGDTLTITRDTAGINPAATVWLDALELEESLKSIRKQGELNTDTARQADTALMLYKGEFLQGFTVFDCRGFEDWSVRERERLHHLAVDGLSELVNYEIDGKEYQTGMAHAARLLELDPLMESAHRQMMQLLAYSGQRAAALSQYETCQKLLKDELRVEPEAETHALYDQIRTGEPATRAEADFLPKGTVTFLFSELAGSTQQAHHEFRSLLAELRRILRETFATWNGHEVNAQGNTLLVAFSRATQAVAAAAEAQHKLADLAMPEGIGMRMGIHTGEPWNVSDSHTSLDIQRTARLSHTGQAGQVLLSEATATLVQDELPGGASLSDLGHYLFKDLHRPEHIFQLVIEGLPSEFPPLTSVEVLPPEPARLPRKVGICPYRGLSAFQEQDAQFYFGRESFVDALEQAVKAKKLVAVILGSSGSGKSSALFAGLLPRLRKTGGFQFASFRPGSQPFYGLAEALIELLEPGLSKTDLLAETRNLAERLTKGEVRLAEVMALIRKDSPETPKILLVIDQFEELYTLGSDTQLQKAFIDELLGTVDASRNSKSGLAVILLTMRADFMGQALAHRPFADALQEASVLMGPMNRQELHTAIQKPAEMQGAAFEPGLVERILDDVGEKPGNLPLLEFTLTQLWERQTDGWLSHADYESMGCVEGALASYADQVYADLDASEQELARHAFVQLVQPGEGTEDTRRIATREELGDKSWSLVQHLADLRMAVTGLDAQGREIAEVVHEALIQRWGRFREWMNTDHAFRAWQERLRGSLKQWQESGQDEGALLAGAPLAVAQDWLLQRAGELNAAETGYIQASQALQARLQKERQRRRQWTFIGLSAGLAIALVLVALVYFQRQNALRQAAIQLSGRAENELANGYHDLAVLLASAALENYPYTPQAEHALGQAVTYSQALQQYTDHTGGVTSLDWSPDGSKIATSSIDNTVRVWNPATGETSLVIELPKGISGNIFDFALTVKWSPDGKSLLTLSGDRFLLGSQDYDLILWDAATGAQVKTIELNNLASPEAGEGMPTSFNHYPTGTAISFAPLSGRVATLGGDDTAIVWDVALQTQQLVLIGHENDVNGIVWSPDEQQLATASEDGTARIWDAVKGEEVMALTGHAGAVNVIVWSPDGTKLATGSDDETVRIWDAGTGEMVNTIEPMAGVVWSLVWSPDGKQLIIGTDDKSIHVWDFASRKFINALNGHTGFISHLTWSPGDGQFASAGSEGTARVWNVTPGSIITLPYRWIGDVDWSSDSRFLAVPVGDINKPSTESAAEAIWDRMTGRIVELNTEFDYFPIETSFSPDNRLLLERGPSSWPEGFINADPTYVVDAVTGKTILEINASDGKWIREGDWSPDGEYIVTASVEGAIDVWELKSGRLIRSMRHGQNSFTTWVEWSPDGTKIVSGAADGVAHIWDAKSGADLLAYRGFELPTSISSARWSPDGKYILTTYGDQDFGTRDNTARIWDVATGRTLLVIDGHTGPVTTGVWSPDGSRIATISTDDSARIWDAASGVELLKLSAPTLYFSYIAWSPDGKYIAIGLDGSGAKVFRAWQSTQELIDYAKECCVIRELTEEERTQFGLP